LFGEGVIYLIVDYLHVVFAVATEFCWLKNFYLLLLKVDTPVTGISQIHVIDLFVHRKFYVIKTHSLQRSWVLWRLQGLQIQRSTWICQDVVQDVWALEQSLRLFAAAEALLRPL